MGSPPPEDAPPPAQQEQQIVEAGFEPSPKGASLCGFGFPSFNFAINIPGFKLPDIPPKFFFALSLNCDLSNPIDVDVGFGGGRASTRDPSPDDIDE